jgi:hypothetical protein
MTGIPDNRGFDDEAFMLLRSMNPVPDADRVELPPMTGSERLTASGGPDVRRRRRRRRALWIVPITVVGTASLTAALVAQRVPTNPLAIGCYSEPSLDADTVVISVDADVPSPIADCTEVWRDGDLEHRGGVPRLIACVLPSGAIGVFPAGKDCESIVGDDPTPSSPSSSTVASTAMDEREAVIRLRDALVEATRRVDCLPPQEGHRMVEDELRAEGLQGWAVEVGPGASGAGFDDERPCVSYSVEPDRRTVVLVPFPGAG